MHLHKLRVLTVAAVALSIASTAFFLSSNFRSNADINVPVAVELAKPEPAGKLIIDAETNLPAVAPLTMNFVRTPDATGPDGRGRFLIAVNSGYGIDTTSKSKHQQTLSVIDLNLRPEPKVVQNIYFPSPQSANVGLAFSRSTGSDGKYRMYVSGGFENKIWILGFDPTKPQPLTPVNKPDVRFESQFIDVTAFADSAPSPNYNKDTAAVYPTGIALSPDGETLYVANNLGDSLGIVSDLRNARRIDRISLQRPGSTQMVYPYEVKAKIVGSRVDKLYVSLWGDSSVAVVSASRKTVSRIQVEQHPTAMMLNRKQTRLYVVNSDADSVSVIDTATDRVIETINVRMSETAPTGAGPEGVALSEDEKTLFVANAHVNAVAMIRLGSGQRSKVLGFIPTGSYPSSVFVVGDRLFVANGKGTGAENSSHVVNESGLYPNMPNKNFPGERYNKRGMYSAVIVSGNISMIDTPNERELFAYTQKVMTSAGLLGRKPRNIFPGGKSPFKHVIYVIRENRTYDQVFGDLTASGDGSKADGDPSVAIFGASDIAKSPRGAAQNITPNARALALRFGLLDRFFVNAEASPDGHNWSTAAFSTDYVDKAFRWNYSGRGRTYDFEGFNRLPSFEPPSGQPPVALPSVFDLPATVEDVVAFEKRYVPYLHGDRDVAEPSTLYLWDAAKKAGLSYRSYGEFVATVSADDLKEVNTGKSKKYPDISPTLNAFATKKALENHFSLTGRNFDTSTPDIMTTESYLAARQPNSSVDAAIVPQHADPKFRGSSRFGEWQREFRGYVSDLEAGKGDALPNLTILRLSNDHTAGVNKNVPTPQFFVAENDYALGRLVEEVSKSPYWKDTAIFVVEDDAQDGPDHVDAHRSPALVISAYNRQGSLVHEFHNTVSLIRTLELCVGIAPMNFLDAHAVPIDIFTERADLRPFNAVLPSVDADNLFPPANPSTAMLRYMQLTNEQDLSRPDMANPRILNEIIWYSVRGESPMPDLARHPAFDVMTAGIKDDDEGSESELADDDE